MVKVIFHQNIFVLLDACTSEIVLDISSLEKGVQARVETTGPSYNKKWPTSFWTQFKMLSWRNAKQSRWRIFDECILAHAAIVAIAYCVLYYQIPDTIETLRDRMGAVSNILLERIMGHKGLYAVLCNSCPPS